MQHVARETQSSIKIFWLDDTAKGFSDINRRMSARRATRRVMGGRITRGNDGDIYLRLQGPDEP